MTRIVITTNDGWIQSVYVDGDAEYITLEDSDAYEPDSDAQRVTIRHDDGADLEWIASPPAAGLNDPGFVARVFTAVRRA